MRRSSFRLQTPFMRRNRIRVSALSFSCSSISSALARVNFVCKQIAFLTLLLLPSLVNGGVIETANQLIREGRYEAAKQLLQGAKSTASEPESQSVEKMLGDLQTFRDSRAQAIKPASNDAIIASGMLFSKPNDQQKSVDDPIPFPGRTSGEQEVENRTPSPPEVQAAPPSPPKYVRSTRPTRIIALGGYKDSWSAACSYRSPYEVQKLFLSKQWPEEDIQTFRNAGYLITATAGDNSEWAVVMSRYRDGQRHLQFTFGPAPVDDQFQSWIADAWNKGYRITSVAGFNASWVITVTSGTGWGKQRFTTPSPYNSDWVSARLNENFRITSAAGDRHQPEGGVLTDTYVLVATQGTGWIAQRGVGRLPRAEFKPWMEQYRDSMLPVAFVGYMETPGAFVASGLPFGTGWGYLVNTSGQNLVEWCEAQRIDEPER